MILTHSGLWGQAAKEMRLPRFSSINMQEEEFFPSFSFFRQNPPPSLTALQGRCFWVSLVALIDYRHTKVKSLTLCGPNSNKYLGCGYKGLLFCRNNDWIIENMGNGLTIPKGWRHFVDNDISWTLFFKMGDFSWTFWKGDFSWTLLVTSRGHFWLSEHCSVSKSGGAGAKPLLG
jgi:hypothetical protein